MAGPFARRRTSPWWRRYLGAACELPGSSQEAALEFSGMATTQHRCSSSAHTCLTRRAVLAAGGATAGALTLAACGPDDGGAPPATATGTSGGAGGRAGGAGGVAVAALHDVPAGGATAAAAAAGEATRLTRPAENEVRAFSSVCTHQGCAVEPGSG